MMAPENEKLLWVNSYSTDQDQERSRPDRKAIASHVAQNLNRRKRSQAVHLLDLKNKRDGKIPIKAHPTVALTAGPSTHLVSDLPPQNKDKGASSTLALRPSRYQIFGQSESKRIHLSTQRQDEPMGPQDTGTSQTEETSPIPELKLHHFQFQAQITMLDSGADGNLLSVINSQKRNVTTVLTHCELCFILHWAASHSGSLQTKGRKEIAFRVLKFP